MAGHASKNRLFAHALNLCEVYYDFSRANGETTAWDAIQDLLALGITERNDLQTDFLRAMGRQGYPQACLFGRLRGVRACE
jgi:hypothetical protein